MVLRLGVGDMVLEDDDVAILYEVGFPLHGLLVPRERGEGAIWRWRRGVEGGEIELARVDVGDGMNDRGCEGGWCHAEGECQ